MNTLLSKSRQLLQVVSFTTSTILLSSLNISTIQCLSPMPSSSTTTNTKNSSLFRVVHYESGQTDDDLPIFAATEEGAAGILDGATDKDTCVTTRSEPTVQQYPEGVYVIHDLLSPTECDKMIQLSEQMGYTKDAPVSLGRKIRQNDNCVWIMDPDINQKVLDRIQHLLPSVVEFQGHRMKGPIGLNRRWRFYRYHPHDIFKRHTDGPWPPAGIDREGNYVHDTSGGTALTWLTFLIYLNDDFEGGSTKFPHIGKPDYTSDGEPTFFEVQPTKGSVLVFFHGYHDESKLHEGSLVTNGTKYVARTEVLYPLPFELAELSGG